LVLQGGGALGAYQAGTYDALCTQYRESTWVAGTSIGAINAALICGNQSRARVARLREFWDLVSSSVWLPTLASTGAAREVLNEGSVAQVMMFGVPGFFVPRFPPPPYQPRGTSEAISYCNTAPLRQAAHRRTPHHGQRRIATGLRTGRNRRRALLGWRLGLEHATPVRAGPTRHAAHSRVPGGSVPGPGAYPDTLAEAGEREKDIRFSSRTRLNTTVELDRQVIAQAARRLHARLPREFRDDPDMLALLQLRSAGSIEVVHLIYRDKNYETQSKDHEFSRLSMNEHWDAGHGDMARTLRDRRRVKRRDNGGIQVFDLTADDPHACLAK
jgi:NTE family protein